MVARARVCVYVRVGVYCLSHSSIYVSTVRLALTVNHAKFISPMPVVIA